MTSFTYNNNVPATNNNPSDDQPRMLTNTQSINSIVNVDHIGFGQDEGGRHKQCEIFTQEILNPDQHIPAGLVAQSGTIYTKDNATPGTDTNLYYTPDASSEVYQITNVNTTFYNVLGTGGKTTFGAVSEYNAGPPSLLGGWTFLPGGLYLQYGKFTPTDTPTPITFPITFPNNLISVVITLEAGSTNRNFVLDSTTPPTTAGFSVIRINTTSLFGTIYWQAIGN